LLSALRAPAPALPFPLGSTSGSGCHIPNLGPAWKAGQSGNLDGRSISLVNLALEVRRATRGGRELVELHLGIARGELIPVAGQAQGQRRIAISGGRLRLAGRLRVGREEIELTGEASPAQRLEFLHRLSDEDRDQLRAILTRALNGTRLATRWVRPYRGLIAVLSTRARDHPRSSGEHGRPDGR
jgi:hypothetical protein